jgi:hypothetical protein
MVMLFQSLATMLSARMSGSERTSAVMDGSKSVFVAGFMLSLWFG